MILVTGGTGFLGSRVILALAKKGSDKIRCFVRDNTSETIFDSLLVETENQNIELFKGNFNSMDDWERSLEGVHSVIHLAASTGGSVPVQIANTVVGSEHLFKACIKSKIKRFVLCSSLGVLKASALKKFDVVDENCPFEDKPELRDPYSYAKIIQEKVAWDYYEKENLPLVVIRPSVIFGPPQPILSARIGISLFGIFLHLGGNNTMPLTYKDNCADAIVQAAFVKDIEGQIFHISDDDLPKSKQILKRYKQEIEKIHSVRLPYSVFYQLSKFNEWYSKKTKGHLPDVFTPYKVKTMWKNQQYSNDKAKKVLGWNPTISMDEAMKITFNYIKNNT